MAKKREITKEEVVGIDHVVLANLVFRQIEHDDALYKKVEKLLLVSDPKALVAQIKKEIGSIKRGRKFISYYESFEFAKKIEAIVDDIKELVKDKKSASKLYKELILTDSKVYGRSDDSSGSIQMSYALANKGYKESIDVLSEDEIYKDILEMRICEGFGVRDVFSEDIPESVLQRVYDQFYEIAQKDNAFDNIQTLLSAAHYLKKPQLYIDALKLQKEEIYPYQKVDIAQEYKYANNPQKALEILEDVDDLGANSVEKFYEIQIWAYEQLGKSLDITRTYKEWYEKYKSVHILKKYLDRLEGSLKESELQKALLEANTFSFSQAMHFFKELDAQELAAQYIFANHDKLETEYFYQKEFNSLVKWLQENHPQEAILLCRDLCEKQLATSQSKYYPSGINALKKAIKIEKEHNITEWKIEDNVTYMQNLFEKHNRKPKFVQLFLDAFGGSLM